MPVIIPDETLRAAGLTEAQAKVEIACRLFEAGTLALWPAAKLADLSRVQFEAELLRRGIAVFRPTLADLEHDVEALRQMGI